MSAIPKWTYEDSERPSGECYDCGLGYGVGGFGDLQLPDDVWEEINPTQHEGAGLLCPNCIFIRLRELGISNVDATIWVAGE